MTESPQYPPLDEDDLDTVDEDFDPDELEDDPAYDPDDDELKDIKGG